jgi:hypothetical protein
MSVTVPIELPWHRRLVDDMVDAYAEWRHECAAVQAAYDVWSGAAADDELLAFAAYEAAVDREELASQVYADLVRMVLRWVVPDDASGRSPWRAVRSRLRLSSPHRGYSGALSSDPRTKKD